jgi:Neuraminidase (sialidase)
VRTFFDASCPTPGETWSYAVASFNGTTESARSAAADVVLPFPATATSLNRICTGAPQSVDPSASLACPDAVLLNNGRTILLAYTKGHVSNRSAHIAQRTSTDNGANWSAESTLLGRGDYDGIGKPDFYKISSAKIGMVYSIWTGGTSKRAFRSTTDNGATWSPEVIIGDDFHGRNSSGCTANGGRLIAVLGKAATPTSLYVTYSDDEGLTWTPPAQITTKALGESASAYLGQETVLILSRSKVAAEPYYHAFKSTDNGLTFTEQPDKAAIWSGSDNPPELTVIPGTSTVLAVVNGYKTRANRTEKDRRSSGVFVSTDGGDSWSRFKLIDYIATRDASQQPNCSVLWKDDHLFFFTGNDGSFHPQGANGEASEMKNLSMKIIPRNQLDP